jgi:hypothetical protein
LLQTLSVGWDGRLYDCDFNQQLEITMTAVKDAARAEAASAKGSSRGEVVGGAKIVGGGGLAASVMAKPGLTVFDIARLEALDGRPIKVDNHCFGCTAGAGSSCQGAVDAA